MKESTEDLLRRKIEILVNFRMQTRRDFDRLSTVVYERTGKTICATTLRRFWGYQEPNPSRITSPNTLNLLSRTVGAKDWQDFQKICQGDGEDRKVSSSFVLEGNILKSDSLRRGRHIVLTWAPDRRVELKYQGNDEFRVMTSENSKLLAGDTFHCSQIMNDHPLYCSSIVREGSVLGDYCCGEQGGVRFNIVDN